MKNELKIILKNSDKKSIKKILLLVNFLRFKFKFRKERFANDEFIKLSLNGKGLEIGALSSPFKFNKKVEMEYADVFDVKSARVELDRIPIPNLYAGSLVEPKYIMQGPEFGLEMIRDNTYDFCFSSHALEHSPNIVFAIAEQIRVTKTNGKIYSIVPNMEKTYDRQRTLTPVDVFIQRYESSDFSIPDKNVRDLLFNTVDHPLYLDKSEARFEEILNNPSAMHHYFVYSPTLLLEILIWIVQNFGVELVYFHVESENIHFMLNKL